MTPPTPRNTYLFERIFVCLAILSPIVMVIVAGTRPVGTRGAMIVTGHLYLAAILGLAVLLRVVYLQCDCPKGREFSRRREAGRVHGLSTAPQRTSLRVGPAHGAPTHGAPLPRHATLVYDAIELRR